MLTKDEKIEDWRDKPQSSSPANPTVSLLYRLLDWYLHYEPSFLMRYQNRQCIVVESHPDLNNNYKISFNSLTNNV